MSKDCQDKIPFKTKEEAEGAAALARFRYGSSSHKVYQCKDCGSWHIARSFNPEE